jgi:RNA polymerase sigma factor (sigma-70 family)
MTEPALLSRVALGDEAAVADLYDRYGGLVYTLARRSCSSEADACDAVQDVFVDLWKCAGRYRPEVASETTFVAMIARRRLIDRRRSRASAEGGSHASQDLDALAASRSSSAPLLEVAEEAAVAAAYLDKLPSDQRQAIQLAVYDGLTHAQIAERTGLALGTVKSHLRRGLLTLREKLAGRGPVPTQGGV